MNIAITQTVTDIPAYQWNRLVGVDTSLFMEWEWFAALEASGSISAQYGWHPMHIVISHGATIIAIAPLYIRMHSWGELAFDHVWQNAAQQVGFKYFPKIVGMVPATPCSAYRFLISDTENQQTITALLCKTIDQLADRIQAKTIVFNFVDERWKESLQAYGFYPWMQSGFIWKNNNYPTFEAYRQIFNKNQRRNIKRERDALRAEGVRINACTGNQISELLCRTMHTRYAHTNHKFGPFAAHFLNSKFFSLVARHFAHRTLLCAAYTTERGDDSPPKQEPLAMSMLFFKNDTLYGRYWGATYDMHALHFNMCYYAPIEWGIAQRIRRYDPGIGGRHKIRRGFQADIRYSLLTFKDTTMQSILRENCAHLNTELQRSVENLNQTTPLR